MINRIRWATLVTTGAIFAAACSSGQHADDERTGAVHARVARVPDAVHCLQIRSEGESRTIDRLFPVSPGNSTTLRMRGLPTGPTLLSANAFDELCDDVTTATPPSWLSDVVPLVLQAGVPANVTLSMQRNTEIIVTVDFNEVEAGALPAGDAAVPPAADGGDVPSSDSGTGSTGSGGAGGAGGGGDSGPCVDPNPPTCEGLDMQCGFILDACGQPVDCGTCPEGTMCRHPVSCSIFCSAAASTLCGPICNPSMNTPTITRDSCLVFEPPTAPCVDPAPPTCEGADYHCGTLYDACGRPIECGDCGSGQTCALEEPCSPGSLGLGCIGVPHVCQGCTAGGCSAVECGAVVDCNGVWQECNSCPSGQSCVNNSCQCPDRAIACAGRECGSVTIGVCTYSCGSCQLPEVCDSGACVDPCANVNCGTKHICINGSCEPIDLDF